MTDDSNKYNNGISMFEHDLNWFLDSGLPYWKAKFAAGDYRRKFTKRETSLEHVDLKRYLKDSRAAFEVIELLHNIYVELKDVKQQKLLICFIKLSELDVSYGESYFEIFPEYSNVSIDEMTVRKIVHYKIAKECGFFTKDRTFRHDYTNGLNKLRECCKKHNFTLE